METTDPGPAKATLVYSSNGDIIEPHAHWAAYLHLKGGPGTVPAIQVFYSRFGALPASNILDLLKKSHLIKVIEQTSINQTELHHLASEALFAREGTRSYDIRQLLGVFDAPMKRKAMSLFF